MIDTETRQLSVGYPFGNNVTGAASVDSFKKTKSSVLRESKKVEGRPRVLFLTEGSYPFTGGGVSTWSHILLEGLGSQVDFIIFAITGNEKQKVRYQLPPNVTKMLHLPLWCQPDPLIHYDDNQPYYNIIKKRVATTSEVVQTDFLPLFDRFLDLLFSNIQDVYRLGELFYRFRMYFNKYDYKTTIKHEDIWNLFVEKLTGAVKNGWGRNLSTEPTIADATTGLQWLYYFMLPLSVDLPEVDLSHTTLAGFPGMVALSAKLTQGTPYVITDHGVFIRERLLDLNRSDFTPVSRTILASLSLLITKAVYAYADMILPVTNFNTRWEKRLGVNPKKIKVIPNGINPSVFKPTPKPGENKDTPVVVAAAQVGPLKDILTMIRVCDRVRKIIPSVRFIVYGSTDWDKSYAEKCRKLIRELDLSRNFEFGGFHERPQKLFNEGDISLVTSISEGFPYVVLESMSCARPVVATDVGGIRDALDDCGILCKPRDVKSLADGVITLLLDDDLRIRLGKKARERVLLHFTREQSVNSYLDVYKQLTGRGGLDQKPGYEIANEQNEVIHAG